MEGMTQTQATPSYHERLWPTPALLAVLLLLIPAVTLVVTPIDKVLALPVAIIVYLIIAGTLVLLSPVITVREGVLTAGRARIPVEFLGDVEALGSDALRSAIGPGLDARTHLVIRGWIHRGVRIEVTDPQDPTPSWILTTRHPERLANALGKA